MGRAVLGVAALVLVVYALIDCIRSDGRTVRTLPKALWIVLILVLPVLGALGWLLLGRRREGPQAPPERRSKGPDDDPDFLWRLEQERRRRGQGGGPEPKST